MAGLALLIALAFIVHGPIAQLDHYHAFADTRAWQGLPNAADVLSNLGFLAVALFGLIRFRTSRRADRAVWTRFTIALLATALGSTVYHLAPGDARLVFDRLPIAWACTMLSAAFLGERLDARWRSPAALVAAFWIGTASVLLWWAGQQGGSAGDLRAYLYLQVAPMLVIPLALVLRLRAAGSPALPDGAWWMALALYALAKVAELRDDAILQAFGALSGHTLKHLLAAGAACALLRAATPRRLSSGSRR